MAYKSDKKRSDTTEEKILQTAIKSFAAKGLAGSRVDEIAKEAGVNKASIYYHIGDKEALYKKVLNNVLAGAAEATDKNRASDRPVKDKLREHIRSVVINAVSKEHFAPLFMQEVASGGENMPEEALIQMGHVIASLTKIIEEGVKSGEFRSVNPFALHMMIVGGLSFYSASGNIRKRMKKILGGKASAKPHIPIEEMTEQVADIIIASLRK